MSGVKGRGEGQRAKKAYRLTPEEARWVLSDPHVLARRIRFWLATLAAWPFPEPPLTILEGLFAAMRWHLSSARKPSAASTKLILEAHDIGVPRERVRRYLGASVQAMQHTLVIHGRV